MSKYFAVETIDEAWEETRDLLLPFNWKTWTRLMVIVIFAGGGLGLPTSGIPSDTNQEASDSGTTLEDNRMDNFSNSITSLSISGAQAGSLTWLSVASLAVIIVSGLFYLSSVFEFIFYQSLLDKKVRIRTNFSKHVWNGLKYLIFRSSIYLGLLLLLVLALVPINYNPILAALLVLFWILLLIPALIFLGLTNNFVLVRVIETEDGIIEGWKCLKQNLAGEWKQLGFYIFMRFILKTAVGAIGFLWALITLIAVGIPIGLIGYGLYSIHEILVLIPATLGILLWITAILAYKAPAQTFLYNYAILVYNEFSNQ